MISSIDSLTTIEDKDAPIVVTSRAVHASQNLAIMLKSAPLTPRELSGLTCLPNGEVGTPISTHRH